MREGPPISITDNAVVHTSHVTSEPPKYHDVDIYTTKEEDSEVRTRPFIHPVELRGEKRIPLKVDGLFDEGVMISLICNKVFPTLQNTLRALTPSLKTLQMADGTHVPSQGCWSGDVTLSGHTVIASFEIFPSGGGWSLLFGKPLLRKFKAVHDYGNDTIKIPQNWGWSTIVNACTNANFVGESENIVWGEDNSPSRQVSSPIINNLERFDKQAKLKLLVNTVTDSLNNKGRQRPGRRAHNKQNHDTQKQTLRLQEWWNSIWTVQDSTTNTEELGDLQPEVETRGDHSLFTRTTSPRNLRCVAEILKHVSIGSDLTEDQQHRVHGLISEFTDCFALSVREVIPIPGAEHLIHIPPNVTFPKKIPHQRQLTEAQCAYLSDAIDELLVADIIEPIRPEDVKCASPITLAQKVHCNPGLSLN